MTSYTITTLSKFSLNLLPSLPPLDSKSSSSWFFSKPPTPEAQAILSAFLAFATQLDRASSSPSPSDSNPEAVSQALSLLVSLMGTLSLSLSLSDPSSSPSAPPAPPNSITIPIPSFLTSALPSSPPKLNRAVAFLQCIEVAQKLLARGVFDSLLMPDGTHSLVAISRFLATSQLPLETENATLQFLLTSLARPPTHSLLRTSGTLRSNDLLAAVRVAYNIFLCTQVAHNRVTARATLEQMVAGVFNRMERYSTDAVVVGEAVTIGPSPDTTTNTTDIATFPSLNHKDAFLLFRSLCKLSMKPLPDSLNDMESLPRPPLSFSPTPADDSTAFNLDKHSNTSSNNNNNNNIHALPATISSGSPALESKVLALELLLSILENASPASEFVTSERFAFAIRHYLCVSLLKNCMSNNTRVVSLSLRLFVPIMRQFKDVLKAEIEIFITNIFFVILDSGNSRVEHKSLVINLFGEICADPETLAEIFLNYDCQLKANDLFARIVVALERTAKTTVGETTSANLPYNKMVESELSAARLRLDAMRSLTQVLNSLFASISVGETICNNESDDAYNNDTDSDSDSDTPKHNHNNLVQLYDSKKKLQQQQEEAILKFNQNPKVGIKYLSEQGLLNSSSEVDVARYLLESKDVLDKTQIGEYMGREQEYAKGFNFRVMHAYVEQLDFENVVFDEAIRHYLSGFRLPGEAQKIDRMMEKFAERFHSQNPDVFPSADIAFILAFSVIMLNTDLHNPNLKEDRRMNKEGFLRNNRGIADGKDLPSEMLSSIFDRIQKNQISLKEDDMAREKHVAEPPTSNVVGSFFSDPSTEVEKKRATQFSKERDLLVKETEFFFRQRRRPNPNSSSAGGNNSNFFVRSPNNSDEFVGPMFSVTWAPCLSVFAIAMESSNGTDKKKFASATDLQISAIKHNAESSIETCLIGFKLAISIAGATNNEIARATFVNALANFAQLGSGRLLETRHVQCTNTILSIALNSGEFLESTWEHVFKIMSEVSRLRQVFERLRTDDEFLPKHLTPKKNVQGSQDSDEDSYSDSESTTSTESDGVLTPSNALGMSEHDIDEMNASNIHDGISEDALDRIFQSSSRLSEKAVKDFLTELCKVSRMEIGGYKQQQQQQQSQRQTATATSKFSRRRFVGGGVVGVGGNHQPVIFSLQKLVEVSHFQMDTRGRLSWEKIWDIIASHFVSTALDTNEAVCMYAVDSLRQLSIKFLQKEETSGLQFQKKFLKPFEEIMRLSVHESTRDLVLQCIEQIQLTCSKTLKSGMHAIINVIAIAGGDSHEAITSAAFSQLSKLLQVQSTREAYYDDIVNCLFAFAAGRRLNLSVKCMAKLNDMFDAMFAQEQVSNMVETLEAGSSSSWTLILGGFTNLVGSSSKPVRIYALNSLTALIEAHCSSTKELLQLSFRNYLATVFEHAVNDTSSTSTVSNNKNVKNNHEGERAEDDDSDLLDENDRGWVADTFDVAFESCSLLNELAKSKFNDTRMANELLAILSGCICQDKNVALAIKGLGRLDKFVASGGDDVSERVGNLLVKSLKTNGRGSSGAVLCEVMKRAGSLVLDSFSSASKVTITRSLCLQLVSGLGSSVGALEMKIDNGVRDSGTPPTTVELALFGRGILVKILLNSAGYVGGGDAGGTRGASSTSPTPNNTPTHADRLNLQLVDCLRGQTQNLIQRFLLKEDKEGREEDAEVLTLTKLVGEVLSLYADLDEEALMAYMGVVPLLSALIQCNNKEIRVLVHKLFSGPLTKLLNEKVEESAKAIKY